MPAPRTWRGAALGAPASLVVYDEDARRADAALEESVKEISRLEHVFSLHRANSALSRLNRDGRLLAAPRELCALISRAQAFGDATQGAFDVTVQPVWALYARHFVARPDARAGPGRADVDGALQYVDYRAVDVGPTSIRFDRRGMAVTLNGIAQGYIVDSLCRRLGEFGLRSALLDAGELRALGRHPEGRPWAVGVRDPDDPGRTKHRFALDGEALATSAGYGTVFDRRARYHHLLDPRDGRIARRHASVSVACRDAATADALSTAFSCMPVAGIERVIRRFAPVRVLLVDPNGTSTRLQA